jgi:hypothetical protein
MNLDIQWEVERREDWERVFAAAPRSNLLQGWAYGQAKAKIEHVTVRRAFVRQNGEIIGLMQVLDRGLGPLRVTRLNRGPLWLSTVDPATVATALRALRADARWWRGRLLLAAPELPSDMAAAVEALGYRKRGIEPWRSAWIDLSRGEETLRRALHGKWRNMLNAGERAGIEIEASAGDVAFFWLLKRYAELMIDRQFTGIPVPLLGQLRNEVLRPEDLTVYRAKGDEGWLAGALIARHGTSATYLVGWSGNEGRRRHAANVLLFHVMRSLAQSGCRWFDLGGIDAVHTSGIARFKRGLGGDEYVLAGEYVSL